MRLTEGQLRRIIRRELQLETAGFGLALADTFLPDEYKGLLDPRKPETFLLNPVTALDPTTRAAAKELSDKLSLIPVIGAPFNVTSAIYEALDGDYDKAAVSLAAAIFETYLSYGLGTWIKSSMVPIVIGGKVAMRTGVLQASVYAETVTTFLLSRLQEIIDDALDHVAENERKAGDPIPPAQLQQMRSALMTRVKPDIVKDQVVKQTADVIEGRVVGIPEEMEAEYIPPAG